jgi:pimeloyl-ACP methyl ester carboxylesterase
MPEATHSRITGPRSTHGTLLLHGAGGSPEANFPFQAELSGRVVAPYYPGHGPAPICDGDLGLDILVADAMRAADEAGLATMDIVGFSLGSAVAVQLAARHPERVRRLVLAAGIAHASPSLRLACQVWIALLEAVDGTAGSLALGRFVAWASSSEAHWTDGRTAAGPTPDEIARLIADNVQPGTADAARLICRLDTRPDLLGVAAPTLVVVPTADRLVDPSHAEALLAGIADTVRIDIPAGHNLAWEAPGAFAAAIRGHLDVAA